MMIRRYGRLEKEANRSKLNPPISAIQKYPKIYLDIAFKTVL
jgi:hypothetical protein